MPEVTTRDQAVKSLRWGSIMVAKNNRLMGKGVVKKIKHVLASERPSPLSLSLKSVLV